MAHHHLRCCNRVRCVTGGLHLFQENTVLVLSDDSVSSYVARMNETHKVPRVFLNLTPVPDGVGPLALIDPIFDRVEGLLSLDGHFLLFLLVFPAW